MSVGPEKHGRVALMIVVALLIALFMIPFVPALLSAREDTIPCRSFVAPQPRSQRPGPDLSRGKFLVAARNMKDQRFAETVLLLIDYSAQGAMGLIINRPTDVRLFSLFPDMPELKRRNDIVYIGGPINNDLMFVLIRSRERPAESLQVSDDIYISSSKETLRKMAGGAGAGKVFRVYAGYAGWSSQQLDQEVMRGDWHVVSADSRTIFDKKSSEIWPEMIRQGSMLWVGAPEVMPFMTTSRTNTDMIHLQACRVLPSASLCRQ